jgi:hypothetical protein
MTLLDKVMRLAADCKNMATEISLRRTFLDRFNEALLRALRESEGSTIIGPPGKYRSGPLPNIGEDDEPGSSSSSSRSSSRASRRSRSRTHKPHHPQASWENGRHPNRPHPSTSGGGHHHLPLSRSSSSSSLRLDQHGVPLEDAELNETHFVEVSLESDVVTCYPPHIYSLGWPIFQDGHKRCYAASRGRPYIGQRRSPQLRPFNVA